ncbi:MAG: hypothetical protein ABIG67_07115 [Pseudomonadota bacterium]
MKRYLLSPLCSAFIVPGLGQIINHNLKKGVILLFVVFMLLMGAMVKMAFIVTRIIHETGFPSFSVDILYRRLQQEDLSTIRGISILFMVIWIYSVLDAFWTGKKLESQAKAKNR